MCKADDGTKGKIQESHLQSRAGTNENRRIKVAVPVWGGDGEKRTLHRAGAGRGNTKEGGEKIDHHWQRENQGSLKVNGNLS